MTRIWMCGLLMAAYALNAAMAMGQSPPAAPESTAAELQRITQELLDAVAVGDQAVWNKYLADTCLYISEDGRTLTKAELIEELRPLPAGYKGQLRVANAVVREYGDTAVITYDAMEDLEIYGQKIKTHFHTTDTYLKREGRWQMIASQVQVLPSELMPIKLEAKALEAYTGVYELAPGVTYVVSAEGDKLYGQRGQRAKEELFPAGNHRFFRKGNRGEKIFVLDKAGRTERLIDRRDNNDIIWQRVK